MNFYGIAGKVVAPLYNLKVDGKLQTPGILSPDWLVAGTVVWVRQEKMRVSQPSVGDTFHFDGSLNSRIHRPRIVPVVKAQKYVVDRVSPTDKVGEDDGVVYLRSVGT